MSMTIKNYIAYISNTQPILHCGPVALAKIYESWIDTAWDTDFDAIIKEKKHTYEEIGLTSSKNK